MAVATSSSVANRPLLPSVIRNGDSLGKEKLSETHMGRVSMPLQTYHKTGNIKIAKSPVNSYPALNVRCAAGQTQTLTRESRTTTRVPGKDKTPELDKDDGQGWPPLNGGGGGGGGGGGSNSSGGWFLFGFLGFLDVLKEEESKWFSKGDRR